VETFPIVDDKRLLTELEVIYKREEFRNAKGAIPILKLFLKNNLQDTFQESTKLLKIVVTIPMSTSEAERCFSTLKRIKTFLRNTMTQDRLSALAMLSIEKRLVRKMQDFNQRVIEKFASQKNRRMDFIYK
jgi:hypothetical protein